MKVTQIIGNVGKKPEMKFTPEGKAITEFSVAVNEGKGENKKTEWVKVIAWEKTAEVLNEYLQAGSKIYISGKTKIEAWIDKNSSEARAQLVLTVSTFEFLGDGKKKDEGETPY